MSRARRMAHLVGSELAHLHPRLLIAQSAISWLPPLAAMRLRTQILRTGGVRIGQGSVIMGRVVIAGGRDPAANLVIGRDCVVNTGTLFDATGSIRIGDGVSIGQEVVVLTSAHALGGPRRRAGQLYVKPVSVGDGAWLSTRCVVLPGVDIGRGAVVAAGAVVTRSVPANTLVAGVPARPVRELETQVMTA